MNNMTDQQTTLAALRAQFPQIVTPPGWTKSHDLALYRRARKPEGAPPLPADATKDDAFAHAFRLLKSAHRELGTSLAVRAAYNAECRDLTHVQSLLTRHLWELAEHFRSVDTALPSSASADVQGYIDSQADEAKFLELERERLLAGHCFYPGSVSLCELYALTTQLGNLALGIVEHFWDADGFEPLFSAVETAVGADCLFLHTRAMPDAAGEQTLPAAA